MTDNRPDKTYIFDARRATPRYPEANRYCCSILPELAELLHKDEELHIIISAGSVLPEINPLQRLKIHCTNALPDSRTGSRFVKKIIKQFPPDLFHSATLYNSVFTKKSRAIATVHENCPLSRKSVRSSFQRKIDFLLRIKPRLNRIDTFITISSTLLSTYADTEVARRAVIIPYGVSPQFKILPQEDIDAVKEKYSLPRRFLLIIMAEGNTSNLTAILDAIQSTDFTETAPLVIAGYGSRNENIKKLIEQRRLTSRIHQIGPIEDQDMPALYNAAFALLFPNITKGTGMPVMESMACGTPVICSSLPALVELTAGSATLVHPTCKLEWRRAINTALVSINWREESRVDVLKRAESFSWKKAAEETLKIYRQHSAKNS